MTRSRFSVAGLLVVLGLLAVTMLPLSARGAADEPVIRFDGHKVVRTFLTNRRQLDAMLKVSPDVWSEGIGLGQMDFRVPPDRTDELDASGVPYEVLIEDLQVLIDMERNGGGANPGGDWFAAYKTYDEVNAYLDTLAALNPDIAETFQAGTSLQGRPIRGIRIGDRTGDEPAFLMHGCQHAREWIAVMVPMFIADHLVRNYNIDPEVTRLVEGVEFMVVPIVNPDGYVYTRSTNRMWRKNRRDNGGGSFGIDLNRNWSYEWGHNSGSSGDPNSDVYRGPAPFSEPESSAMRDLIDSHPRMAAHLDIHSYSQLLLFPWGYTTELPPAPDHAKFQQIGKDMQGLIRSVHDRTYVHGATGGTLYLASGVALDYSYGVHGIIGFTIELRDTGQFGFVLPPDQIIPNGEEILPAILYLGDRLTQVIEFSFPQPLPEFVPPDAPTPVQVRIVPVNGRELDQTRLRLVAKIGEGDFEATELTSLGDDLYEGMLPAAPCGSTVEYYFRARTTLGELAVAPPAAPDETFSASVIDVDQVFSDDFQNDRGWTVENINLSDGEWTRGVPAGDGTRGDPTSDYDGSGACWLTDNVPGNSDVDGGPTRLTSPRLDCSGFGDHFISYARWFFNDDNDIDRLDVHLSDDDGATWTLVESVTNTGGWVVHRFRVGDFVDQTSQVRIRFSATDNPNDSVTEAGVDAFRVESFACDAAATLTNAVVTTGSRTAGGLPELEASDDAYFQARSGFGSSFIDLHMMQMRVEAETTLPDPALLDLRAELHIDEPSGLGRLRLRNWDQNLFQDVASFTVGSTDRTVTVRDLDAATYVRDTDGEMQVQIKVVVVAPIFAFFFDTFVDEVRLVPR